jgi:hypothetical protein
MMAYNVSINEEDDKVVARCEELDLVITGDSRTEVQNKLANELKKRQQALSPIKDMDMTVVLRPHEVDALRTVLRLVMDGKLDHILYEEEEDADSIE